MNSKLKIQNPKLQKLVPLLLDWFSSNARDLPWRRTRDPYAIWVSEIMLQQTQVKTVLPYWERWMRELPTIETVATASPDKIHKLWEGLGYYTRARNLQKAAKQLIANRRDELHESQTKTTIGDSQSSSLRNLPVRFPETFIEVLALPGIGRYTAGAICSIAFNQPTPILDGNVIRVLTRIFGVAENPKDKETNAKLWSLAEALVENSSLVTHHSSLSCSHLNQSLMELGALICTPRNPRCEICPVRKLCFAFKEDRAGELPNLGKRDKTTARKFVAFVIEKDGKFLVQQRPDGIVNAHLWEFPNVEVNGDKIIPAKLFQRQFSVAPRTIQPLQTVKHSITRYRITLEAFAVRLIKLPAEKGGVWKTSAQLQQLAFTSAHGKVLRAALLPKIAG